MKKIFIASAMAFGLALAGCSGSGSTTGGEQATANADYNRSLNDGFVMLQEQRYGDAKSHFTGMSEAYPGDPTVALALGVAHHELGEWDAAYQQYDFASREGNLVVVKQTIHKGEVKEETTTIANLAHANIEQLREDRPQ